MGVYLKPWRCQMQTQQCLVRYFQQVWQSWWHSWYWALIQNVSVNERQSKMRVKKQHWYWEWAVYNRDCNCLDAGHLLNMPKKKSPKCISKCTNTDSWYIYISSLVWTRDMLLTWTSWVFALTASGSHCEQSWAVEAGDKTKLPGPNSCVQEHS